MSTKTCAFCGKTFERVSFCNYLYKVDSKFFCSYTCYKRVKWDGKRPTKSKKQLNKEAVLSEDRKKLADICDRYLDSKGISKCTQSVITRLYQLKLLDNNAVKMYLEGEDDTCCD